MAEPLGPGSAAFTVSVGGLTLRAATLARPDAGPPDAGRGLALLLQGRTEFIEKYAPIAQALAKRGFTVATLDWRGQGGSPRLLPDRAKGHVDDFDAYQRDLAAFLAAPRIKALGPPKLVIAHSMGGAVALRAVLDGRLDAPALVFSAPMWGLAQSGASAKAARFLARALGVLGLGARYAPGNGDVSYALTEPDPNVLTADPKQAAWIARLTGQHPDKALGGVTWGWLRAAYREMAALAPRPLTRPALVIAGGDETVTSLEAMRARAERDSLTMTEIPGGRHELFFETAPRRQAAWDAVDAALARAGV